MATVILGIVGAGAGALIAGPAGAWKGAELGWAIGTAIGGIIDQPKYPKQAYGRLSDLRVTTSSYGNIIPRVWGKVRVAGNIIWSTQLAEHEKDYNSGGGGLSGGGGGQTTQVYTYTASFALSVAKGGRLTSSSLKRIHADDKVIYDSANGANANIRWYPGTNSQTADPLMVAKFGSDAPAFRNTAYIMFQDLLLTDFGSRIPNISVELDTGTITLDQVVTDVCSFVGLAPADIDVSQAAGTAITGIVMTDRISAKDGLQPVLSAYAFDMIDVDGVLRLVKRGGRPVAQIDWQDMGAVTGVNGIAAPVSRISKKRLMEWELPKRVDVTYYSLLNNFQQANQGAVRQTVQSSQYTTISLPMSLDDTSARNIAERELYLAWIERNTFQTAVLPGFTYLSPADPVLLDIDGTDNLQRCRIDKMETGVVGEIRLTLVIDDEAAYTQLLTGSNPITPVTPPTDVPTTFFAWSGKEIQDADQGQAGFYVAATGDPGWRGTAVYFSIDNGVTFVLGGRVSGRSTFGPTTTALAAVGALNAGGFDVTNTVNTSLYSAGQILSTSEASVNTGQGNYGLITPVNQALVTTDYELMGIAAATLVSGSTYTLSDILRGQRTTTGNAHISGDMFVKLDKTILRVPVPSSTVGNTVLVKCLSSYQSLADVSPQTVRIATPTPNATTTQINIINTQIGNIGTVKVIPFWRMKGYINSQRGTASGDRIDSTYFDAGANVPAGTVQYVWTRFSDGPGGSFLEQGNLNWALWGRLGILNSNTGAITVNLGIPYVDNFTRIDWITTPGPTKILWSWTAGAGAAPDYYKLYRSTSSGTEVIYQNMLTSTSFTDTNVVNGTTYYGYVTEVRGGIESAHSAEVSITAVAGTSTTTNVFNKNTFDGNVSNNSASFSIPAGISGVMHAFFFNEQSTYPDASNNPSVFMVMCNALDQAGVQFVDAGP